MSVRGREFVDHWVFENINASPYQPDGGMAEGRRKAEALMIDAQAQGVSKIEIEEEVGDLAAYLSGAIESATDAEVTRLAARRQDPRRATGPPKASRRPPSRRRASI
jgi:hypothetical protein